MYEIRSKTNSTELYLRIGGVSLKTTLRGLSTTRQRRALLQAIVRKILPLFDTFADNGDRLLDGYMSHFNGNRAYPKGRDMFGLRPDLGQLTETPKQKVGFKIRMQRLKYGMTQKALAEAAGINRSHLSEIEKGHCLVRETTLKQIEAVFESRECWPTL